MYNRKYQDALDALLDRPIAFNPAFKKITKSTVAALFLSQAWYWSKRTSDKEGWFYKTGQDWEEETGLTRCEQETARKKLQELNIMEEKLRGVPATLYFKINKEMIYSLLGFQFAGFPQTGLVDPDKVVGGNPANIKDSENTKDYPHAEKAPKPLSQKDLDQCNAKVDDILAQARKAEMTWQGREKIPEGLRALLDVYNEMTGQRPTKGQLIQWLTAAQEWHDLEITEADLREAYKKSRGDAEGRGGFFVGSPFSLTKVAGAFAGERRVKKTFHAPRQQSGGYVEIDLDQLDKQHAAA